MTDTPIDTAQAAHDLATAMNTPDRQEGVALARIARCAANGVFTCDLPTSVSTLVVRGRLERRGFTCTPWRAPNGVHQWRVSWTAPRKATRGGEV